MTATSNKTVTVRVDRDTHETLTIISGRTGESMSRIVARAVDRYWRNFMAEDADREWARLAKEDPAAIEEYRALVKELDGTIADGLEDEEW